MIRIGAVKIKVRHRPKLIEFARLIENGESVNALFTIACTVIARDDDLMTITYTRTA